MISSKSALLASAILGSLIKTAITGPLDCVSGPCVTVEGVGEHFYPYLSKSIKFEAISTDHIS